MNRENSDEEGKEEDNESDIGIGGTNTGIIFTRGDKRKKGNDDDIMRVRSNIYAFGGINGNSL